jgi:heme iron utilization protein
MGAGSRSLLRIRAMADAPLSNEEVEAEVQKVLNGARVAVLATNGADGPMASQAPFLLGRDWTRIYLHLSRLAQHTRNLESDSRVGWFLSESDAGEKNPFVLKRISLTGSAHPLPQNTPEYEELQKRYIARFPQSQVMFQLPDFQLWALEMDAASFVAGFGRAFKSTRAAPSTWTHTRP